MFRIDRRSKMVIHRCSRFRCFFFVRCLRPPSPLPCCVVDIRTCNRWWDLAGMGIMSSKKYLNGGYGDSFVDNFPQKKQVMPCGMPVCPGKSNMASMIISKIYPKKYPPPRVSASSFNWKRCVGDSIPKGSWWQIKTWKTSKWPNGHKTIEHKQVEVPNGAGL